MNAVSVDLLTNQISSSRLSCYETYLGCSTYKDKLGAYMAYQSLSGDFFLLLQMIEVTLRNLLNETLSASYGDNWFDSIPVSDKSKNHVSNAKLKFDKSKPSFHDDVISQLPFGFWVYLLDACYRDTKHSSYIWTTENQNKCFHNVKNILGHQMKIKAIFEELKKILTFRNRLFHHEPIWKKHNCTSHESAVKNLKNAFNAQVKFLFMLSEGQKELFSAINVEYRFNENCNEDYIKSIMASINLNFPDEDTSST